MTNLKSLWKKYHYHLALIVFVYLTLAGMEYELTGYIISNTSYQHYLIFFASLGLLAVYLIPFTWGMKKLRQRYGLSQTSLALTWFGGLFIPGWLSAYWNGYAFNFFSLFFPKTVMENWGDALTAPLVEEGFKGLAAFLLIVLLKVHSPKIALLIGMVVGMGFQVVEDISYASLEVFTKIDQGFPDVFLRIATSATSHWVYTGIFTTGLFLLFRKMTTFSQKQVWFWLIFPVLIHFFWNSPLYFAGSNAILGTICILVFLDCWQKIDKLN